MEYPPWAPPTLVKLHISEIKNGPSCFEKLLVPDPESTATSPEQLKKLRKKMYRSSLSLPWEESTALLGRLITDPRMKNAWAPIDKRVQDEYEHVRFWWTVQDGVREWRADQQLTKVQRKKFFHKVRELSSELSEMLLETNEFQTYSISELVTPEKAYKFLKNLETLKSATLDLDRSVYPTLFLLQDLIPNIHTVLEDIGEKASQYAELQPLVKKPSSGDAGLHYFVRTVSKYLNNRFGQPLHEIVAITAGVVFDKDDVDVDRVRSLLNPQ